MKLKVSLILLFIIFHSQHTTLYAQNKTEDYFDTVVGKENLPLNNGAFYFSTYKTLDTHPFYNSNKFSIGSIIYDEQLYNNVNLKYDNHRDILVFKPYGETENFGIILTEKMIKEFTLQNKHFINLSLITKDSIKSIQGFYEENWQGSNFIFFIKHKKDRREYIKDNVIYNEFGIYNEFLVAKNNSYFIINSKKNITDLFKEQEKEIRAFYDDNSKLSKENKTSFYEKLFRYIDQLQTTK